MNIIDFITSNESKLMEYISILEKRIIQNPQSFEKAIGSKKYVEAIQYLISFVKDIISIKNSIITIQKAMQGVEVKTEKKVEQRKIWYTFKVIQSFSQLKMAWQYNIDVDKYIEMFERTVKQIEQRFGVDITVLKEIVTIIRSRKQLQGKEIAKINDMVVSWVYNFINS